MAVKTFAAIDVGSYELAMKIFEVSKVRGMNEIDHIRHSIDMGTETYGTGKLSYERMDELCRVLREFSAIMKSYQVKDYKAYGTSAIRESQNRSILLDQIEQRTGIVIDVLNNSEQRFLDYKSIAFQGEGFQKIIENGTAILDIGGGSIQISLFDNDTLVSTQNMKLGVLRLQERLNHVDASISRYDTLIEEIVESQMNVYKKLYLKDRQIKSIIVVDDYISALVNKKGDGGANQKVCGQGHGRAFCGDLPYQEPAGAFQNAGYAGRPYVPFIYFHDYVTYDHESHGCRTDMGARGDAVRRHCLRICREEPYPDLDPRL